MHKIYTGFCFALLFCISAVWAQKPVTWKDAEYDLSFISLFSMHEPRISLAEQLDPFYQKDTLTGLRAAQTAVVNELGLKGYTVIDGHRHGTSLEIIVSILQNGTVPPATGYSHAPGMLRKIQKAKGLSVLVEMVDPDKEKLVWAGWCSMEKIKADTPTHKLQKAIRSLIEKYPL